MPNTLAAMLPYVPASLTRTLLTDPTLAPVVEEFPAAVLFADISGFTPLTEALARRGAEGPEEMTRLLNTYFSRLIAAIEAEGGEVVKFSGNALTAIFPATVEPASHAARRAAQAAVAMHTRMDDFATLPTSAGPIALAVKIGVGVGTVYAFRVGGVLQRWEYVVAGDPLRQVAEAEHAASPGATILSPETTALLADLATPHTLPPCPLTAPYIAPGINLKAATVALSSFIPGAIRARLGEGQAACLAALGMVAGALGDFAAAQEALDQALALNRAIGERRSEAAVRADLALLCHQRGDHQAAREHAQTALELASAVGARAIEGTALTRLGHALEGLTDWQGAEAAYQAALRLRREMGAQTLALVPLAGLARLALARGELAAALALANELVAVLEARTIDWVDELPQSVLSCYQVLSAAGDTRPVRVLEAAYALIEHQASQISDVARRQAFWAEVPAHRALLAARVAQESKC